MPPQAGLLLYEDDQDDVFLIRQKLKGLPIRFYHASDEWEFKDTLAKQAIDVVLSDYGFPTFNGLDAMLYLKEYFPEVSLLFVTGTIYQEELAQESLLQGAEGYILKTQLGRLPGELRRVLQNRLANGLLPGNPDMDQVKNQLEEQLQANRKLILKMQRFVHQRRLASEDKKRLLAEIQQLEADLRLLKEQLLYR